MYFLYRASIADDENTYDYEEYDYKNSSENDEYKSAEDAKITSTKRHTTPAPKITTVKILEIGEMFIWKKKYPKY